MKSRDEIHRRLENIRQTGLPDRRYRLACEYVRQRLGISRREDASTKTLRLFLESRRERRTRAAVRKPDPAFADLKMAFRIRFGQFAHFVPLLESYLLSGRDDAAIADMFHFPEAAVSWFRKAFFDVDELLPSYGRILYDVIRINEAGRPKWDFSKVLKVVGYVLKAPALDQLLGIQDQPIGKIEPHAWLALQGEAMAGLKQFLAMAALDPGNASQAVAVLKLMPRSTQEEQETKDELHKQIAALLSEIPWAVGDDGRKMLSGTKLGQLDEGAAELRDEQVLRLSAGEEIRGLEEDLLHELPPPRPKNPVSESAKPSSPLDSISNRIQR